MQDGPAAGYRIGAASRGGTARAASTAISLKPRRTQT